MMTSDPTFLTLLEATPDAMVIVDAHGRIVLVNTQAERLFAYEHDEMVGQPVEILVPPRSRNAHVRHRAVYTASPGTRPMGVGLELHGRRKDGSEFPVEISLSPLHTDGRTLTISAIRDVTDRKNAEQERARLVEERASQAQASRMKDEFIATLSHELRTPLNAIIGWTTLLTEGVLDEAGSREALVTIARNARVQAHLVEDLIDVSRFVSAKMTLHLEPLDLADVIENALSVIRPSAEARGVILEHVFEARPLLMIGDSDRLQQAIWNLLSNAVKFTDRGGRVEARAWRGDDGVCFEVRDTGRGIDVNFLPYVFDLFRQADSTSTREHGGLGLGLSLVKSIVELHGGTVVAESGGLGRGAAFRVVLPARGTAGAPRPEPGAHDALAAPTRLDGIRIVVVDDQRDERQLLSTILGHRGARVRAAESVEGALQLIQEWPPDLVISDVAMPDDDGYVLVRRLRGLAGPLRGIPAIALTAHARAADRERALAAGFQGYLSKPIEPSRLVDAVVERLRFGAPSVEDQRT